MKPGRRAVETLRLQHDASNRAWTPNRHRIPSLPPDVDCGFACGQQQVEVPVVPKEPRLLTSLVRTRRLCRQTGGSRASFLVQCTRPDMTCRLRSPAVPA